MKTDEQRLSLYRPATYQIKVPGLFDKSWSDWLEGDAIIEYDLDLLVTILTVTVDQAALLGLLRHLYSLGLPLISVICLDAY